MSTATQPKQSDRLNNIPDSFIGLQEALVPLRPIRTKAQYNAALRVAGPLAAREDLTQAQSDYLETLSANVEAYEQRRFPIRRQDPVDVLAFLLEENGLTGSDLGRILGHRALGSKILNRKRGLSVNHIRTLADYFAVNPALFLP